MTGADGAETAPRQVPRGLVTLAVMLATIMQTIDTTIANVALPHMQGSMSASLEEISWVLTSYIVAAAIMTPPTGWLAMRLGRKRLFLISVAGFTIASMLCGAATSLVEIVLFRLLQGAFGAGLVPLSQATLLDTYPREQHGQAMALWGLGVVVGPIIGPTLGGWLTETYSWRWVFYINLPIGVLALLGILAFVPETPRLRERRFDFLGFALLSLAIGAFQMLLDRGQSLDWFGSTEIILEAVVGGLALYLFLVQMFTAKNPFIEPGLFNDRNFAIGLVCMFMVGVVLLSTMALLPPFLQSLMGYPVLTAGIVLAPRGAGTMLAMFLVGRLIGKVDGRVLIVAGLCLAALSLWDMSGFTTDVGMWDMMRTGAVQGLGLGMIFVPLSTLTFATLAPRHRNEGASMFSLIRNVGGSIGISIVTTLLAQNSQVFHATLADGVTPFRHAMQHPWLPRAWDWARSSGVAALNEQVTHQAVTLAYLGDFTLMMWVSLLVAPLVLLLRKPPRYGGAQRAAG